MLWASPWLWQVRTACECAPSLARHACLLPDPRIQLHGMQRTYEKAGEKAGKLSFCVTLTLCGSVAGVLCAAAMMCTAGRMLQEKLDVFQLTFYTAPVSVAVLFPFFITREARPSLSMSTAEITSWLLCRTCKSDLFSCRLACMLGRRPLSPALTCALKSHMQSLHGPEAQAAHGAYAHRTVLQRAPDLWLKTEQWLCACSWIGSSCTWQSMAQPCLS